MSPIAPGDRAGDLRDLEGVGEPRALVVVGEDEDLRLAGQSAEGGRVEDAVAVALEAGAERVGLLVASALPGAGRLGGERGQVRQIVILAGGALDGGTGARTRPRTLVCERDVAGGVTTHRGRPAFGPLLHRCIGGVDDIHAANPTRWVLQSG